MNFFAEFFTIMSLTGTIPFILYLLLKNKLEKSFSASVQYNILMLCLICYLVPFSLIKELVLMRVDKQELKMHEQIYMNNKIILTMDGFELRIPEGYYRSFWILWCGVIGIIFLYILYKYFLFRRTAILRLEKDTVHQQIIQEEKKLLKIKRKITLLYSDTNCSPFTYGVFHPHIVLTSKITEDQVRVVLYHELQHIYRNDFAVKLLAFISVLIHCCNPFIYFFWKELKEVQELVCDEKITDNMNPAERKEYGHMIIDTLSDAGGIFVLPLSKNGKVVQRRIKKLGVRLEMKKGNLIFLTVIFLLFTAIPVWACSPSVEDVRHYEMMGNGTGLENVDWVQVIPAEEESLFPKDELHFGNTDQYLIMQNGEIIELSEVVTKEQKSICYHKWEKVVIKKHFLNDRGGCTVFAYDCECCKLCREIRNEEYLTSTNYRKCPH